MPDMRKLGAEHTVDVDLLPVSPVVLDVGCRGFEFDFELLKLRPTAKIIALDPDPKIRVVNNDDRIVFHQMAVTELDDEDVVEWQGPGEGGFIANSKSGYGWPVNDVSNFAVVRNVTIRQLMEMHGITHWDLVKLDCEGSEFGILENWPGPIATQLSIEFHDFVDRNRWNDAYYEKLFAGPLRDYDVRLFGLTGMGPGNHQGHWDSVLVLR